MIEIFFIVLLLVVIGYVSDKFGLGEETDRIRCVSGVDRYSHGLLIMPPRNCG